MLDGRKTVGWGPAVGALVVGGMALGAVWLTVRGSAPPGKPVYTREGYGGIRMPTPAGGGTAAGKEAGKIAADPVAPAMEAYNRGDYAAAESAARTLLTQPSPAESAGETSSPPSNAVSVDQDGSNTQYAIRNTQQGPTPEHLPPTGGPEHPNTRTPERARARWVLAFSAARKKDLAEARAQFAALKREAAGQLWALDEPKSAGTEPPTPTPTLTPTLTPTPTPTLTPLRERPVTPTGELLPTLEEEAAYQHAVLTAALGKREAAETEFVDFMRKYPESLLVHAVVRRIGRFHGGDLPKEAEAVWKRAMATAEKRRHARDRARSLCAPAVLAEILRRTSHVPPASRGLHGNPPPPNSPSPPLSSPSSPLGALGGLAVNNAPASVEALAREMNTDHRGTALSALTQAAEKRGFQVSAYRLTWRALLQKMPLAGASGRKGAREQGAKRALDGRSVPNTQYALRNTKHVVAFLEPGHVVIVEQAAAGVVRVWDPDGAGPQTPAPRTFTQSEWLDRWKGVTLILER